MSYLISQIFFCLLLAFLLGLFLGWLLFRCRCEQQQGVCNNKDHQQFQQTGQQTYQVNRVQETAQPVSSAAPVAAAVVSSFAGSDTVSPAAPSLDSRVDLSGPGYEIETLEGIGPKIGERMREAGMPTVKDFISRARLSEHREQIAQIARVMKVDVDLWAGMADLMRVSGLNHQAAELIYKTGIKTAEELGAVNASELKAQAESANAAGAKRIAPTVPSLDEFVNFVAVAKQLKAFVKF